MWIALWLGTAAAEVPLPSYREQLAREVWSHIDARLERGCAFQPHAGGVVCAEGVTDAVVEQASAFRRHVFDDAGIAYLQGLAHRYAGEERRARTAWIRATELDPEYRAAWYDLGELHLVAGRYADAEAAFRRVADLAQDTPMPWLGYQRLAEVAALRQDPAAFESNVKLALERGFSFRQVVEWPNWQAFAADPVLRDTLAKLLTVYATDDVRRQLLPDQDAPPGGPGGAPGE